MVAEIMRSNIEIDVRSALPAITVPRSSCMRRAIQLVPVALGRWLAEHIPSAEFVEIPGAFHGDWNTEGLFPEAAAFLAGDAPPSATDRMLATVLFTDIVSSTETDVRVGDHRWRELLDRHDDFAKRRIARHRGRLVKTTGDGLLATFDGPARAITCAQEIALGAKPLGLDIRAGLHTGEVEMRGDDITGLGVVIARRVCDLAARDELLASRTVKDLVIGSGISLRRPRRTRAQGRPRRLAAVRGFRLVRHGRFVLAAQSRNAPPRSGGQARHLQDESARAAHADNHPAHWPRCHLLMVRVSLPLPGSIGPRC